MNYNCNPPSPKKIPYALLIRYIFFALAPKLFFKFYSQWHLYLKDVHINTGPIDQGPVGRSSAYEYNIKVQNYQLFDEFVCNRPPP